MKILHVITGLAPGGAENQLRLLVSHSRHAAQVVALTNAGSVAEAIASEGTPVFDLHMKSNRDLRALGSLWRMMTAQRADVIHLHLYRSLVYGRFAAALAGSSSVVSTEHSLGDDYLEGRPVTSANRMLYLATEPFSDATIAVSEAVRRRLVAWGVSKQKIVVVPNGVDFPRVAFDPGERSAVRSAFELPEDAFVIGVLGRLDEVKRVDGLLDILAPSLGAKTRLLIVGAGPMRDALEQQAAAAGVLAYVVFAGEWEEVGPALSAMDVLAAPSASETFGLAVVEALGAGLPVVYCECPAVEELPDGGRPLATRAPLEPDEFRRAIEAARLNPGDRRALPSVVGRFGIEACARRVDEVYESLAR